MAVIPAAPPARWHRRPGELAWALWVLATLGIAPIFWLDHLLRQAGRPELALLASEVPILAPACWRG
jgi:hypothetical protein